MYQVCYEIYHLNKSICKKRTRKFHAIKDITNFFRDNMDNYNAKIIRYWYRNHDIFDFSFKHDEYTLHITINKKNFVISFMNIRDYQLCLFELYGEKSFKFVISYYPIKRLIFNSYID